MSPESGTYEIREVQGGVEVDAAYAALDAWFGVRAELERRSVVDAWLAHSDGVQVGDVRLGYHLLTARTPDGTLAAVRDCHITVDPGRRICVIYLAHVYVMPEHRRTGLAQRLRDVPLELARRDLRRWGLPEGEILFAAEQEFFEPTAADTAIRLVAYGRTGYRAIPPRVLPYAQADFRDVAGGTGVAQPLPLLAIVRRLGHEREATLPVTLAVAYVEHLYAVFSTHCRSADLVAPRRHALAALAATGLAEVPLLPLPTSLEDHAALSALSRSSAMPYFPTPVP
jgi:GNAT superfamily N-acetyltransferase